MSRKKEAKRRKAVRLKNKKNDSKISVDTTGELALAKDKRLCFYDV